LDDGVVMIGIGEATGERDGGGVGIAEGLQMTSLYA